MSAYTLREALQHLILTNDFIEDGLVNGYINITGLALHILPTIRKKLGREDISVDAVKMGLARSVKGIVQSRWVEKFHTKNITIKKNLNVAFIKSTEKTVAKLSTIQKEKGKYLTKINGGSELVVSFDDYYKSQVREIFLEKELRIMIEDVALISVKTEYATELQPGIFYRVSKSLYFYGINIVQAIQLGTEIKILVRREDLREAFGAISWV